MLARDLIYRPKWSGRLLPRGVLVLATAALSIALLSYVILRFAG